MGDVASRFDALKEGAADPIKPLMDLDAYERTVGPLVEKGMDVDLAEGFYLFQTTIVEGAKRYRGR